MELGLLFLFGLTITSTAGSSPPRPRSLPAGGDPRSAALGQKQREESGAAAVPGGGRAKAVSGRRRGEAGRGGPAERLSGAGGAARGLPRAGGGCGEAAG